jgi:hypothetical protein
MPCPRAVFRTPHRIVRKGLPFFMRRLLVPLALLIAPLAVPAGADAYTLGVSDQQASTFANPLFAPLKFRAARYIAPYDAMSNPEDKQRLTDWLQGARFQKQRILVSFEHSRRPGKVTKAPSVTQYTAAIKQFHKAFPFVKEISPWNEVNRCQTASDPSGQPTCGKEKLLAQYYSAARKVFGSKATIVALDVLDEQNVNKTIKVIRTFLKYAKPRPKILGFHNYSDTNRFSTSRTRRVLAAWPGDVWLTETGGIVTLGKSFPRSTTRAAKALGCMFTLAKTFKRIKRLYVYQFNGAPTGARFDAGLISPDNKQRPGYSVVMHRKARACRA